MTATHAPDFFLTDSPKAELVEIAVGPHATTEDLTSPRRALALLIERQDYDSIAEVVCRTHQGAIFVRGLHALIDQGAEKQVRKVVDQLYMLYWNSTDGHDEDLRQLAQALVIINTHRSNAASNICLESMLTVQQLVNVVRVFARQIV
jgi:hypothetical protein